MTWFSVVFITFMFVAVVSLPLIDSLLFAGSAGAAVDACFVLMCIPMFYNLRNVGFFRKGQSGFTVLLFLIAYIFHPFALISVFSTAMSKGEMTIGVWLN